MKKFLICFLVFLFTKVNALPVGNPIEASLFLPNAFCDTCNPPLFYDFFNIRLGFYGDYVFNRRLETVTDRKIDFSQITTNAAYIAFNFCKRFDLFTTLGASKFSLNTSLGPFNPGNTSPRFEFESSTAFSWSVGGRATLCEFKCLAFGVEGQYFSSNPYAKRLFIRANVDSYPDEGSNRKYSEWQLGAGVAYNGPYFIPYAAIKYARARYHFDNQFFLLTDANTALIPDLRNQKSLGFAFGLTFIPFCAETVAVTIEGRFVDETALYVNGQISF